MQTSSSRTLFISELLLYSNIFVCSFIRATIDVDESGTVAAAATAVVMMLRCAPAPPQIITIDKPFLFVLHKNDNILFAGRVAQF